MSYKLTPSCSNLSPRSDGEVINQSTADVDRIAETSDTVGATILQKIVTAVNGGTDTSETDNCKDENNADAVLDYFPTILAEDYSNDDEFKNLYSHLIGSEFLGNDKDYRQVLMIADQYLLRTTFYIRLAFLEIRNLVARTLWSNVCVFLKYIGILY